MYEYYAERTAKSIIEECDWDNMPVDLDFALGQLVWVWNPFTVSEMQDTQEYKATAEHVVKLVNKWLESSGYCYSCAGMHSLREAKADIEWHDDYTPEFQCPTTKQALELDITNTDLNAVEPFEFDLY